MSTDLYGIRILEVDPEASRIRMRVFVVYYDTSYEYHQPIPDDRSFFVRVLCDDDAFGDDISDDDRFDEKWIDANAFRFIDRFVELETRNYPVESYEGLFDFYYARGGTWQDEDKLVQADYDVFVTKPEYLESYAEGDSWGTTSYPTKSDDLQLEDYPHIPLLSDVYEHFDPFSDLEEEHSVVEKMRFSPDAKHIVMTSNEGDIRVFKTSDWSKVAEFSPNTYWWSEPYWIDNHQVVFNVPHDAQVLDIRTNTTKPFEGNSGPGASPTGRYFVNDYDNDDVKLFDQNLNVIYEGERPRETMVYTGFSADETKCALAIEVYSLHLIDVTTGDIIKEYNHNNLHDICCSPDAKYFLASDYNQFMIIRASDGAIIRTYKPKIGIPTHVAWSTDGQYIVTATTDQQGLGSTVKRHRTGTQLDAALNASVDTPAVRTYDLSDFVQLYIKQVAQFEGGWRSHLDDDYLEYHVTLKNMGFDMDLTPHMHEDDTKVAARAYESVIAQQQNKSAEAKAALAKALEILGPDEGRQYGHTFVYAPLAAAHYLQGDKNQSKVCLDKAKIKLDEESNPYQKSLVLARAILLMGKKKQIGQLIEQSDSYLHSFQRRALEDLARAGEYELFVKGYKHWNPPDRGSETDELQDFLASMAQYERAIDLDWLGTYEQLIHSIRAWLKWYKNNPNEAKNYIHTRQNQWIKKPTLLAIASLIDPNVAIEHEARMLDHWKTKQAFVIAMLRLDRQHEEAQNLWQSYLDDNPNYMNRDIIEIMSILHQLDQPTLMALPTDGMVPTDKVALLAYQNKWEEIYTIVNDTKPTLRNPFYKIMYEIALKTNQYHIAHDAISRMPCSDMNSVGLRAMQHAIKTIAGPHYLAYHV